MTTLSQPEDSGAASSTVSVSRNLKGNETLQLQARVAAMQEKYSEQLDFLVSEFTSLEAQLGLKVESSSVSRIGMNAATDSYRLLKSIRTGNFLTEVFETSKCQSSFTHHIGRVEECLMATVALV